MQLSLDCMTLTNTGPVDLIRSAKVAGFDLVSLWLQPPSRFPLQLVTPAMEKDCAAVLADTGVGVHSLEVFDLVSAEALQSYRPALELGARLGAKGAVAIHARNPDRAAVAAVLAAFVELAGEYGLGVNIEPIAMCQTSTLAQARDLIRAAGVDAGIVFDVYHLVRTGGSVQDVRAIEPALIRHVQVNDGVASISADAMRIEVSEERPYPGEGVFPLVELLSAVPANVAWGIESPSRRRAQSGMAPEMQAREAIAALRRVVDKVRAARASPQAQANRL